MGAVRVQQAVLVAERVVVGAGRGECRAARADRVDVDAVLAGREALDLDVDVDDAGRVLDEPDPADRVAAGVDERAAGPWRAADRASR